MINLSEFCIRRPVAAWVMTIIIVLIGALSLKQLELRYAPRAVIPVAFIHATYLGASAELVESAITQPLETALSNIPGIDTIRSRSEEGGSDITVRFVARRNSNYQDLLDKLRTTVASVPLPESVKTPNVNTASSDDDELVFITFADPNRSLGQLDDYINRYIKNTLQQLPGVGNLQIYGGGDYAVRIWLDPLKMAAHAVSAEEVAQAIKANNFEYPAGKLRGLEKTFTVHTVTRLKNLDDFKNIFIKKDKDTLLRLSDIAEVELGSRSFNTSKMLLHGKPFLGIGISAEVNSNPMDVAESIKKAVVNMQKTLPEGMQMEIVYDGSKFLRDSVNEVIYTIFEAIILVVLVVFLFLGEWRTTLIPCVTIPVCIIGVFFILWLLQFSINTMTLLALVLAIGLVVDDAIVVLENIHRHIENKESTFFASVKGSKEITFAIIGMTITLAAVYAPIGLIPGKTSRLFTEFAYTLASCVLLSGWVALTLSPMMCSRILHYKQNSYQRWLERFFETLSKQYKKILTFCFKQKKLFLSMFLLLLIIGTLFFKALPGAFIPEEDNGFIFLNVSPLQPMTEDYLQPYVSKLETIINTIPEVESNFVIIMNNDSKNAITMNIFLKPLKERKRKSQAIVGAINRELEKIPELAGRAFAPPPDILGGGHESKAGLEFALLTDKPYAFLEKVLEGLKESLNSYSGLTNISHDLVFNEKQFQVSINRELAAQANVAPSSIADTLALFFGGAHITDLQLDNNAYEVMVQAGKSWIQTPDALKQVYVKAQDGKMRILSDLINVEPDVTLASRQHYQRMRATTVSAELAPNYKLGNVVEDLQTWLTQHLPDTVKYRFKGAAKNYLESSTNFLLLFGLAILFIYLVLAALFESFIDPLIVLLTVPFCMVGALFTLWITGGSLNIYTQIGLVTLIGLVSKHGILITQFANRLKEQGHSYKQAAIEAATLRLRPIMMTTATMVLGALPLAYANGPGAVSHSQIGWTMVGGLLLGTFFSLIVIPMSYVFFKRIFRK